MLAEQRSIFRRAFAEWNGFEVDTQGDSFFVAFPRAIDAVLCAVEAQRAVAAHVWPQAVDVRVRVGLHTGEPVLARTGYVGMDVHRAARVGGAGHGGQILLSGTTADLVADDLPDGLNLTDLGAHRLKDMRQPIRIWQLTAAGLLNEHPPLRTIETGDEPPVPGKAPYQGLQHFDVADRDRFFGRSRLTAGVVERISAGRFLAIVGASGSGKSSIARAGLVPALLDDAERRWVVIVLTPTAHPLEALAVAMTRDSESVTAAATLSEDFKRSERSLHLTALRRTEASPRRRVLVVIDQLEEIFSLCRAEEERAAFITNLVHAATAPDGPVSVVVTLRADFYAHCAAYPDLRRAIAQHQEYIGLMDAAELREAIEEPARRGGWEFAPGLVDLILRDVGQEPGALPLLSHALLETWQRRRATVMTLKSYAESGGVRGAIARTADRVYGALDDEQRAITRSTLLRLTQLGDGTQETRRRAPRRELVPATPAGAQQVEVVLGRLVEARLVTVSEGTVEVAHEALIREWPTLREWLAAAREGLRVHRHLTEAADAWARSGRDPGDLYRGARLAAALDWSSQHQPELNDLERSFLAESRAAAARESERQRRTNRRLRALLAGVAVLFVLSLLGGGYAFVQRGAAERAAALAEERREETERASTIADARRLGAQALAGQPFDVSLLLAREAVALHDDSETRGNLLTALVRSPAAVQAWRPLSSLPLDDISLSPDGEWLIVRATESLIAFVETATGNVSHEVPGWWAEFADDGTVVVRTSDFAYRVYDPRTGAILRNFGTPVTALPASGWSPDLTTVSFVTDDGAAIATRDIDRFRTVAQLEAPSGYTFIMAEPHGDGHLLTGLRRGALPEEPWTVYSEPMELAWWPAGAASPTVRVPVPSAEPFDVGPRLDLLAIAHRDGSITLRDLATGKARTLLGLHPSGASAIRFSADGETLVSSGADGSAIVWDVAAGVPLETLSAHHGAAVASGVHTGSGGARVYTAGVDGLLIEWELAGERRFGAGFEATPPGGSPPGWPSDVPRAAATGAGGQLLAVGGEAGHVVVRQVESRELVADLAVLGGAPVADLAFSPDGRRLAVVGRADRPPELWETSTWQPAPRQPSDPADARRDESPSAVAFSPDGRRVAGVLGGQIWLWDVEASGSQPQGPIRAATADDDAVELAFSGDGERLAAAFSTGRGGSATVWRVPDGSRQYSITLAEIHGSLAFSPDGAVLAVGVSPGAVAFHDAASGERLGASAPVAPDTIGSIAWTPSGAHLVAAGIDGTVGLVDVARRRVVGVPFTRGEGTAQIAAPANVVLVGDGASVIAVYADGRAHIWDVTLEAWIDRACQIAGRNLTQSEWERFVPSRPYAPSCPQPGG